MKVLELFAGIGGAAAALGDAGEVVRAIDQNPYAASVYRHNFDHPLFSWNLAGIRAEQLQGADLWWMSPPCQPFTVRGHQRDLDDPRSRPLVRLMELLPEVLPRHLALENVATFQRSRARELVVRTLERAGYAWQEEVLCPTALGVPNRRLRYYLVASRDTLTPLGPPTQVGRPLADYLDLAPSDALYLSEALCHRYRHALPVVDAEDPRAVTFCYTSAYGRSPVHSGSYIRDERGLRRLSPHEILGLLHFPASFELPVELSHPTLWKLVGNSLSVAAAQHVLKGLKKD